jgi:hypothetical protein
MTQLEALAAELPASAHSSRVQGGKTLTYIGIADTINHVNSILGAEWGIIEPSSTQLMPLAEGKGYLAKSELHIVATIDGTTKSLYGVGAMINGDPDMAMKTALAEAIKKAFHQTGVGLYLWDNDRATAVLQKAKLANGSETDLKKAVIALAASLTTGEAPKTPAAIAKAVGLKTGDLTDPAALRRVLTENGLI